ncbi:MAG: hypothetical protein CJBNEKGG_00259 [Prosthecobacter sp.]|nr:hypothetical protein [Prosthecobacter sp.]
MHDLPQDNIQQNSRVSVTPEDVAASFALLGIPACISAVMFWPPSSSLNESWWGLVPIFWIFAGAGLGLLGLSGVLLPSLFMPWKAFSWPRLALVMTGVLISTTGLVTLMKWQAVNLPGQGP